MMDEFWSFVYERQEIWHQRQHPKEVASWTKDPILSKYHFSNVYRELDRGTRFIIENIILPINNPDDDPDEVGMKILFNIILYRLINHPETMIFMGLQDPGEWDGEAMVDVVSEWSNDHNQQVFSPSHTHKVAGTDNKLTTIFVEVIERDLKKHLNLYYRQIDGAGTIRRIWEALQDISLISRFLAFEIAIDYNYYLTISNNNPFSENDFVDPGPGAKSGLEYLASRKDKNRLGQRDYVKAITYLCKSQRKHFKRLGHDFKYLRNTPQHPSFIEISLDVEREHYWDDDKYENERDYYAGDESWYPPVRELSLINIEHSLCEWHKYKRLKSGEEPDRNYKQRLFRPKS